MTRQRGFVVDGVIANVVDEEDDFGEGRHQCGSDREPLVSRDQNITQARPLELQAMKIERRSLLAGASDASGIAVIIDVLRAFTCSALMFRYGIRDLALVRTPQEALAFRDTDPHCLVAGEVKGRKVNGFDVGNSPADIVTKGEPFFSGRCVAARSYEQIDLMNAETLMKGEKESAVFQTLEELERDHISRVLRDRCWRIEGPNGAARVLGMNPSTLRTRINGLSIRRPGSPVPKHQLI